MLPLFSKKCSSRVPSLSVFLLFYLPYASVRGGDKTVWMRMLTQESGTDVIIPVRVTRAQSCHESHRAVVMVATGPSQPVLAGIHGPSPSPIFLCCPFKFSQQAMVLHHRVRGEEVKAGISPDQLLREGPEDLLLYWGPLTPCFFYRANWGEEMCEIARQH